MITATPVPASSFTTTPETSMPSRCSVAFSALPNESAPTAPTIFTVVSDGAPGDSRERRQAATAWFAPLPPGTVEKELEVRVSPGWGRRRVTVTRSVLREPIMVIVLGDIFAVEGGGLGGGGRGERWNWGGLVGCGLT